MSKYHDYVVNSIFTSVLLVATLSQLSFAKTETELQIQASDQWQHAEIDNTSQIFTFKCDVKIKDIPDDFIIGLSENANVGWKNLACIIRFNGDQNGVIDMRRGSTYSALSPIRIDAHRVYQIRMNVDITKHTYSVWITPEGASEILLGNNFPFRTEQQDTRIIKWLAVHASLGSAQIGNIRAIPSNQSPNQEVKLPPSETERLKDKFIALYTGQAVSSINNTLLFEAKEQLVMSVKSIVHQEPWTRKPDLESPQASEMMATYYKKIKTMAMAYCTPGQLFYNDEQLLQAIIDSLEFGQQWISPDAPRPGNWFFWRIGIPQQLLPTILLLDGIIDQPLIDELKINLRGLMGDNPIMNGPNAIFEGYNHLLDGIIRNSSWRIKKALSFIQREMVVTQESTGILEDYSFQFHGRIPYSGGYGAAFLDNVSKVIYLTEGTQYELPREHIDLVARYILRQARWPIIGSFYDPSVTGRSIETPKSAKRLIDSLSLMSSINISSQEQLTQLAAETINNIRLKPSLLAAPFADLLPKVSDPSPVGIRYLYRSDLMIARRARHYISIKMFSDHVRDYEGLWGQNLSGWNLSYGMTHIGYRGDEIWGPDGQIIKGYDWDHLPGTTTRHGARPAKSSNHGKTCFVGGAIGDHRGICGFELVPVSGDFRAKKSYYIFDKGFVAMGSGINSSQTGKSVNTTITQWPMSYKDTETVFSSGNTITQSKWENTSDQFKWAHCDRIGYLLDDSPVNVRRDEGILTMWYDHGVDPKNASYSYTILPNCNEKTIKTYAAAPTAKILSNTPRLHAIEDTKNKSIAMIFWEPGSFADITVDHPAVVFIEYLPKGISLTISNPLHTADTINLSMATPLSLNTLPPEAQATEGNNTTHIALKTQLGRMYRFGWGTASVQQYPREDISSLSNLKVAVQNTADGALVDVYLPPEVDKNDCQLIIYKSKGIVNKEFNQNDFIKVTSSGALRYRWSKKRVGQGYYNIRISTGLHSSWNGFKVKYEQHFDGQSPPESTVR